jgi:hypothetical protein
MVERFVHPPYSDRLFWPTRVHTAGAPFVPGHLKFLTIFSGGFMPRRKYLSDSLKGLRSWPGYQPRLPRPMRMRPRFSRRAPPFLSLAPFSAEAINHPRYHLPCETLGDHHAHNVTFIHEP